MAKADYRQQRRHAPTGEAGIASIRDIAEHGYGKVNETAIDSFTAAIVVQIHDALSQENRQKLILMPAHRVCSVCLKLANKYARGV